MLFRHMIAAALVLFTSSNIVALAGKSGRATDPQDDSTCRSCVSQAASLFASNQLDKAGVLLKQNSQKCPRYAQLHLLYSTILIRQGKNDEAEQEAALACSAQPDSYAAHLQYAMSLLAAQKTAQSAREFESVTNLNPGCYEAWSALSELYKKLRQDDAAAKATEKAACLEPGTQAIKLSVLQNLKRAGRLSSARRELSRLLQSPDIAPEFEQNLATEALQIGAYDDSIHACNHVVKAYPNSDAPLKCMFFAQFLKGQYSDAAATADLILQKQGKHVDVLSLKTICNLHLGNNAAAEADLKKAITIDPSSAFVMLADGLIKLGKGNFEEADDALKLASECDTKGSQADKVPQSLAHLALSRLNRKQGLLPEAAQEAHAAASDKRFEAPSLGLESRCILVDSSRADAAAVAGRLAQQAISADAENPDALLAASFCQLQSGKMAEARKYAEKAITHFPADSDTNLVLAMIAEKEGNASVQKQQLEKGLKIANNDPELLFELGRMYLRDNKAAEAVPLLKQAVERQVRGPEICFALAEACEKSGNSGESLKYYKQSLSQGLSGDNSKQAQAAISRLESNK